MTRTFPALSIVFAGLIVGPGCSSPPRNSVAGPTPVAQSQSPSIVASRPADANFPPRNEPFLFRTNLEAKYRDALRREATSSYVDIEGTIVWTQEYLRYRVNQCNHAEAVARVFRQVDGFAADAVCGSTSSTAFPPRNEPVDFRLQLEQKYRDGLKRSPVTTYVDGEGDVVWTLEYFRYRFSSCGHAEAEAKVFAQIDERSVIPPDCSVCPGPPGPTGFVGWTTAFTGRGTLQITWEPAAGTVTSYVVELGTSPGARNVAVAEVSGTLRAHTFVGLAPGDYKARVRARNACGTSGPSNEANPRVP